MSTCVWPGAATFANEVAARGTRDRLGEMLGSTSGWAPSWCSAGHWHVTRMDQPMSAGMAEILEKLDLRDRIEALSESDREYVFGWLVNAALATVEGRLDLRQAMDAANASRKGEK